MNAFNHPFRKAVCTLAACGIFLYVACVADSPTAGNSSETGNGIVAGTIYNPDGTPAAGATVRFISVTHNPYPRNLSKRLAIIDSTTTDAQGQYTIDSLPGDTINILASGDSGLAYEDSVIVPDSGTATAPPDTLKAPGSINGVVALQGTDNVTTVFALVFGTNTFAAPDANGNFSLDNMAEGTYSVRFISTLDDYDPLDIELTVRAGVDSVLVDTVKLPFKGIPKVTGLILTYDTLKQIVTLTWNQADTGLIQGYNVYRTHSDSTGQAMQLNSAIVTDTTFSDSTATQDQTYAYHIKAVDKTGNEGLLSEGVGLEVVSAFAVVDTVLQVGAEFYSMALLDSSIYTVTTGGLVQVFNQGEAVVKTWSTATPLEASRTYNSLHVRSADTVIIVDANNAVNFYNSNDSNFFAFTVPFTVRGVAVTDSLIVLAGYDTKQITAYSLSGDSLFRWTERGGGTSQFGFLLEMVTTDSNVFVLESNNYAPYGSSWFLLKYDLLGNFLAERVFDHDDHISIRLSEYNGNLYIASRTFGYILDSDLKISARFALFESQAGILPLSSTSFLVADKSGDFVKYERK